MDDKIIIERLNECLDENDFDDPITWIAKPGDKLIGIMVSITMIQGQYGTYPVIDVLTHNGLYRWHASHTQAQAELERRHSQTGDYIGIKYIGKVENGEYSQNQWRVVTDCC